MLAMWRLWRRVGGWRALMAQVLLAWRLAKDPRVPGRVKLILPVPLLYSFTPLNLTFEWIGRFGKMGPCVRPSFKQRSDAIEVMPRQGRAAAAKAPWTTRVSRSEDEAKTA